MAPASEGSISEKLVRQREALLLKLMQIRNELSPPMLLRAVLISVLLQEITVLLEPGTVGDQGKVTLSIFFHVRSRTSTLQPGRDRNKQETVCFADSYWNHVVCQLQFEDIPIKKALGEGAVGLQEREKMGKCTVLCPWRKWWLHSATPLCSPAGEALPAVPVFTHGRGYCSSRANQGSQCRAVHASKAGQTSGQTMSRCHSWLKPS